MILISVTLLVMAVGVVTATDLTVTTTLGQDFAATEGTLKITLMYMAMDRRNRQLDYGEDIKLEPGMTLTKTIPNIEKDGAAPGFKKIPAVQFYWLAKKGVAKGRIRLDRITFNLDGNVESFCYYPLFGKDTIKPATYHKVDLVPCKKQ